MTRTLARVTAAEPPATVRTLADWIAWREAEDQRMLAALKSQLTGQSDAARAEICRGLEFAWQTRPGQQRARSDKPTA